MPNIITSDGTIVEVTPEEFAYYESLNQREEALAQAQGQPPKPPSGGETAGNAAGQALTGAAVSEGVKQGAAAAGYGSGGTGTAAGLGLTGSLAAAGGAALGGVGQTATAQDVKTRFSDGDVSGNDINHAYLLGSDDGRLGTYGGWNTIAGQPVNSNALDAAATYSQVSTPTAATMGAGSAAAGTAGTTGALSTLGPYGAAAAAALAYFGIGPKAGKHKDQLGRDWYRGNMRDYGILDENYRYQAPDGQYFDFGSEALRAFSNDPNKRGEVVKGMVPNDRAYNINWDNVDNDLVGAINPIAFLSAGGNQDRYGNLAGQIYNAAMMTDDPYAFVTGMYDKYAEKGMTRDGFAQTFNQWAADGKLDEQTRDAFISGVDVNTRNQLGQQNSPRGHYAPQPQQTSFGETGAFNPVQGRNDGRPTPWQSGQQPVAQMQPQGQGGFTLSTPGVPKPQPVQAPQQVQATPEMRNGGRPASPTSSFARYNSLRSQGLR